MNPPHLPRPLANTVLIVIGAIFGVAFAVSGVLVELGIKLGEDPRLAHQKALFEFLKTQECEVANMERNNATIYRCSQPVPFTYLTPEDIQATFVKPSVPSLPRVESNEATRPGARQ